MAQNIFLDKNQFVPHPKRNSYDLSKLVNGTYKEGFLYPVDWTEVTYGDSVRLDFRAALRTMPMIWPIQTPILVKFYSFYVRYRTLWEHFTDWRFNNRQAVHPFISIGNNSDFWKTGGLADHLGVPTTYSSFGHTFTSFLYGGSSYYRTGVVSSEFPYRISDVVFTQSTNNRVPCRLFFSLPIRENFLSVSSLKIGSRLVHDRAKSLVLFLYCIGHGETPSANHGFVVGMQTFSSVPSSLVLNISSGDFISSSTYSDGLIGYLRQVGDFDTYDYYIILSNSTADGPDGFLDSTSFINYNNSEYGIQYSDSSSVTLDLSSDDVANPFSGSTPLIPISALPFRAYEQIYRSYFQDLQNEPFILDGQPQYNRYVTNLGDGADSTYYHLFRRNYEADFLTSAKPSPQQGLAPIVGITSKGDITLVKASGDTYTVHLVTDNNDVITNVDFATQSSESDSSVRRTLVDLATSGITINSLRNVNSLQQWLEANQRRGLKFRDQVLSNFGVKLEYKELDMPEFLGGFTIPLNVNTVTQTVGTDGDPLGRQGANAAAYGGSSHSISHYCDEEGCIMTLMCITPIPVYSQLLNRTFLKSTPLDYYNPEFGKIGNQPITYEEVCPIQCYNEGKDVHDVFGYQRPWYHLISSVDEAHGHFRTNMSSFLQMRVFGSTPELGADFLHINQGDMTDVFVVTDENISDSFYGQIGIKKFKKTCIPRYALPSLS